MRRPAAVAGSWYPASPAALSAAVDRFCAAVPATAPLASVVALITPHAGLVYSGGVAAHAWQAAARASSPDLVVLVGPSHYVWFDGVSVWPAGAFDTPLGPIEVDEAAARALLAHRVVVDDRRAHAREHALEMQLPFVARLLPGVLIVPLVMGEQTPPTLAGLADALVATCRGRRALLAASTDLSHFFDADTASTLDSRTAALVEAFDDEGLLEALEACPPGESGRYVMCGGGAAVAVMSAARRLGATRAVTLVRAHSGDVSGDHSRVVGYLAAVFGTDEREPRHGTGG